MKLRRSERMVVISNYLINHPYQLTKPNTFAENRVCQVFICTLSWINKRALKKSKLVRLRQLPCWEGCRSYSFHFRKEAKAIVQDLRDQLSESNVESRLAAIFTYQICLVRHLFSIISVASFLKIKRLMPLCQWRLGFLGQCCRECFECSSFVIVRRDFENHWGAS